MNKAAPVNDELGALSYDTYEVEEIAGENNKGSMTFNNSK